MPVCWILGCSLVPQRSSHREKTWVLPLGCLRLPNSSNGREGSHNMNEEGSERVEALLPISRKRSQDLQRLMTGDLFPSIPAKLGIS